ncbi:MAG: hypothetical protein A2516_09400 [Alphaproteobacteria bacterium RIFOXYD12_FULL_60_8]|nr:MAG: hypothetical protein A2516_09400 [Alphaproteobacteria bacterium RIFOXYD12_FULL_60_8]
MPNIQAALNAMVAAVGAEKDRPKGHKYPVVVTISRDDGTHGHLIAEKLSQKLGVPIFDKELVEKLAERLDTDHKVVKALDEGVGRARDMWLYRLVTGVDVTPGTYRRHLVNVILSLAHMGGIIVGRGAHVVLNTGAALRVRLTGTIPACAKRISEEKGISFEDAIKEVKRINSKRGKFVWDMFQSRLNEPQNFDIVINMDRMSNIDQIVSTLAAAVEAIHVSVETDEEAEAKKG